MATFQARIFGLATLLALTILVGCSSEPTRFAVSGTVTINGQPAALTSVKFIPAGGVPSGGAGITDDTGKFLIGEDGKNSGLLPGEYKVTFSQTLVNGKPTLGGSGGKKSEQLVGEKEGVPADYLDPAKTPITASVGAKSVKFSFEIKR